MFTVVSLAVVAVLVAAGAWILRHGIKVSDAVAAFDRIAQPAPGRVIDLHSEPLVQMRNEPGVPQDAYFPIVEYVLPDGQMLQSRTMNGSRPAPAKVGDEVTVMYDPANPERVDLGGHRMRHFHGPLYYVMAFAFFGMAALTVAVWFLLKVILDVPI